MSQEQEKSQMTYLTQYMLRQTTQTFHLKEVMKIGVHFSMENQEQRRLSYAINHKKKRTALIQTEKLLTPMLKTLETTPN